MCFAHATVGMLFDKLPDCLYRKSTAAILKSELVRVPVGLGLDTTWLEIPGRKLDEPYDGGKAEVSAQPHASIITRDKLFDVGGSGCKSLNHCCKIVQDRWELAALAEPNERWVSSQGFVDQQE
jgi:hypothetical protein